MLEFVSSLKYYSKIWPRANLFSRISNMLGIASFPGSVETTKLNMYDIHSQFYFLWAFKQLQTKKEQIVDNTEGLSFIPKAELTSVIDDILFFLTPEKVKTFKGEMQSKTFQVEGRNQEGYDVDVFLNKIVEEFIEHRKGIIKALKSAFNKSYHTDRGKKK